MKIYIILFIHLFFVSVAFTQAPNNISYQGVVRKIDGSLLVVSKVAFKFRIHQNTNSGTVVYEETQTVSTNKDGLATLKIGAGTPTLGTFSAIDWSTGLYFVRTFIDINGGSNFVLFSVSQFSSVPYALFATKAGSVDYANVENAPNLDSLVALVDSTQKRQIALELKIDSLYKVIGGHFVGERFGGGTVFFVYDNGQHGLVHADTSFVFPWAAITPGANGNSDVRSSANFNGVNGGKFNTELIIKAYAPSGAETCAKKCADLILIQDGFFYDDWYLPSIAEVKLLFKAFPGSFSSVNSSNEDDLVDGGSSSNKFLGKNINDERSCLKRFNCAFTIPIRSF
jgi:hypothetical protein